MNLLFIHQNFPAQFVHVAPAMAARGHTVVALGVRPSLALPGVRYLQHQPLSPNGTSTSVADRNSQDWATKLARAESAARALVALKAEGFVPDVVFAHPAWGEALYVREIFPACRLITYAEYFYGAPQGDSFFDPEFNPAAPSLEALQRLRLKNTVLVHALSVADQAVSPTHFQRSVHPAVYQPRIEVIHEGVDTDLLRPDPSAQVSLGRLSAPLGRDDEVVTFISRQLEPYRGYHVFMRCLPRLLALRPKARVVIVGGDGVAYGAAAPKGKSWKSIFLDEVKDRVDMSRVHLVGTVPHAVLHQLLRVSSAHCYLTYPFVLSWSMLEAMSLGCVVVGSRTAPVEEVIEHGRNGLLTDFFDADALADTLADALDRRHSLQSLRDAARQTVVERYDLKTVCLPRMLGFIEGTGT